MRQRRSLLPPAGIQFALLVLSVVVAAGFEWARYQHFFHWRRQGATFGDRCILFWLIWAKSLWVLLPLLLAVGLLYRVGWRRGGAALATLGGAVVSCWFVVDVRVMQLTGTHLLTYVEFVGDNHIGEWAGEIAVIDARLGLQLSAIAVLAGVLVLGCQRFGRRFDLVAVRRLGVVVLFALSFGVLFAGSGLSNPPLLEQLERTLPVRFGWFEATGSAAGDLTAFRQNFDDAMTEPCRRLLPHIRAGQPLDTMARIDRPAPPNVVIIALESFRFDSIEAEKMPRLSRLAQSGLRFERHYSGSNCSHFGIFGLLYGRAPFVYDFTLDANIPPQLPETFRRSGYRCSYVSSGNLDHVRMNEFISERAFDEVRIHLKGQWPERDRQVFRDMERILLEHTDKPQLLFAFTMSTHYPYRWAPEYARHTPIVESWVLTDPNLNSQREKFLNRYRNSLAFMDDELANFIEKLDLAKTIVVVTGDHGESFWDDGRLAHCSRLSDIQTRVPLVMFGAGVPRGRINSTTRHADVLPTVLHAVAGRTVPLARTHGRDALAPGFQGDEVVLTPYIGRRSMVPRGFGDLLLVKGERRLRVRLNFAEPGTRADACYDDRDNLDTGVSLTPADARGWCRQLVAELQRLASRTATDGVE